MSDRSAETASSLDELREEFAAALMRDDEEEFFAADLFAAICKNGARVSAYVEAVADTSSDPLLSAEADLAAAAIAALTRCSRLRALAAFVRAV